MTREERLEKALRCLRQQYASVAPLGSRANAILADVDEALATPADAEPCPMRIARAQEACEVARREGTKQEREAALDALTALLKQADADGLRSR